MTAMNRPGKGPVNLSELLGWAAASRQDAQQLARRRRMLPVRLTAAERDVCADELAEQYALGRIDDAELGRRVDLLHRAVVHGDLGPVFAGLPMPPLYGPPAVRRGRWRWVVFAGAVWMALPFVLIGLVFLVLGREVAAAVFGLPALVWVTLFWRWASGRSRSDRRKR